MGTKPFKYTEEEVLDWAFYYVNNSTTLMQMELFYNISHSTIWWNFINRLPWVDRSLYIKVLSKIEDNKHIRPSTLKKIKERDKIMFAEINAVVEERKEEEFNMKTGVWLNREYLQGGVIDKQSACSACGFESSLVMSNWKYCPVCGTRLFTTLDEMKSFNRGIVICEGENKQ